MPQGASALPTQGSAGPPSGSSNLDATAQFAFLVETGADAAMALVGRAVAAATRTPTTAALDAATQELVKSAIRDHLKDAGLIPAAHPGDPPATPVPSLPPNGPGGAQPQEQKRKTGKASPTIRPARRVPLPSGPPL